MSKTDAEILLMDIETAPSLGWVWKRWETNVIDFKSDWYVLSYAYKWSTDKKVTAVGLNDFPKTFKDNLENDYDLILSLWQLINQADIIVAHNGDKFDLKKINTRFLIHGLKPPSPYKTIDTLKIARRVFAFDSNKLDDLGHYLGIGRKLPNTGFHLWRGCMIGDPSSWAMMKKYNSRDVVLLEKVYHKIREWAPTHPNVNYGKPDNCPRCGSTKMQSRGFLFSALKKRQRFQCQQCAGWTLGLPEKIASEN